MTVPAAAATPPLDVPNVPVLDGGAVFAAARQPNGGIVFGGAFESVNGLPRGNLARLRPDGTLDPDWAPVVEGAAEAIAVDAAGNVYVGGTFQFAGPHQFRSFLAKFSGSGTGTLDASWRPAAGGNVYALVMGAGGTLYAGGDFLSVGSCLCARIAKIFSGGTVDSTWKPNPNDSVEALAFDGTNIYAGGAFTAIGGQVRGRLARISSAGAVDAWDPSADGAVRALAIAPTGEVYAGGSFNSIGGHVRPHLAKLSVSTAFADATWNPRPDRDVLALAVDAGGSVYAGGWFQSLQGSTHRYVGKLAGSGLGAVDTTFQPSVDDDVESLIFDAGGTLHIGGGFEVVRGAQRFGFTAVASDGTPAGAVADVERPGLVLALARQPDGGLIVGGDFGKAGQIPRANILRIAPDGSLDSDWNPGTNDEVDTLASGPDGSVYAGGLFTSAGGAARRYLVKLAGDGSGGPDPLWNPAPTYQVGALAFAPDGQLVVGGSFLSIGGLTQHFLAKVAPDGVGTADPLWTPLLDNVVRTLALDRNGALYVGGDFSQAGGLARVRLAKIDSGTGTVDPGWDAPADSFVNALATGDDGAVYVGGAFTTIGGVSRNYLAKLDGTIGAVDPGWNPSPDSWIWDIATGTHDDVFASGSFHQIAGAPRTNLARLDSGTGDADPVWTPDPDELPRAMLLDSRDALYIGGSFGIVGGVKREGVAALASAPVESTTLTFTSIDPDLSHAGEPYVVSFRVEALEGTPTGSVTISDDAGAGCGPVDLVDGEGSCEMVSTETGFRTLTALYTSDNVVFTDTTAETSHFVDAALTTVTITADTPDPSEVTTFFELDAHVDVVYPDSGPGPAGTITFTRLDFNESCIASVDASGNASCSVFGPEVGTQMWVASYSGDGLHNPSDSPAETHTVSRAGVVLTVFDPGTTVATEPASFSVEVEGSIGTPTGHVTIGDGTSSCTAEITSLFVSCDLPFPHAGDHEVTATYDGDAMFAPAESEPVTHFVAPAQTAVSIRSHLPEPSLPDQPVTVTVDATVVPPGVGIPVGTILVSGAFGQTECTIAASGASCEIFYSSRGPQPLEAEFLPNDDFDLSFGDATHRVNQLPIANADNYSSFEDDALTVGAAQGVLANDQDPDGDPLTVVNTGAQTASGIGGIVTLNPDGSFTYAPPPNANGTAVFEYTVSDGLETSSCLAVITVGAVNDPPTFALAPSPIFAPGTTGVATTPSFATMTSSGPPDEGDAPLAWHVRVVSDPSGVLSVPPTIALDGTLSTPLTGHGGVATLAVALQDDGGTENGGNDTSPEQTFTVTVGDGTDLSVAIEDDTAFVAGGDAIAYRISVRNLGPEDASGTRVRAMLSANLVDAVWTCAADAGASCTPGGSGEIDDLAGIPAGASVVYTLTATTLAIPEFPAELDATVLAPSGLTDFNPLNDSASDVDAVGIFADGFDTAGEQREAEAARQAHVY